MKRCIIAILVIALTAGVACADGKQALLDEQTQIKAQLDKLQNLMAQAQLRLVEIQGALKYIEAEEKAKDEATKKSDSTEKTD